jgi:hypothetical protein
MSLSRHLSRASDDEFREAMSVFATKVLAKGGSRKDFEREFRPILSAMHRGGADKERINYLRHLAREEFKKVSGGVRRSESVRSVVEMFRSKPIQQGEQHMKKPIKQLMPAPGWRVVVGYCDVDDLPCREDLPVIG